MAVLVSGVGELYTSKQDYWNSKVTHYITALRTEKTNLLSTHAILKMKTTLQFCVHAGYIVLTV